MSMTPQQQLWAQTEADASIPGSPTNEGEDLYEPEYEEAPEEDSKEEKLERLRQRAKAIGELRRTSPGYKADEEMRKLISEYGEIEAAAGDALDTIDKNSRIPMPTIPGVASDSPDFMPVFGGLASKGKGLFRGMSLQDMKNFRAERARQLSAKENPTWGSRPIDHEAHKRGLLKADKEVTKDADDILDFRSGGFKRAESRDEAILEKFNRLLGRIKDTE